jgi:hypothetical protein
MDESQLRVEALKMAGRYEAGRDLLLEAERIYQWLQYGKLPDAEPEVEKPS